MHDGVGDGDGIGEGDGPAVTVHVSLEKLPPKTPLLQHRLDELQVAGAVTFAC